MEQWRDLINPGRQGTMDEHFRVGSPHNNNHPTDEVEDVLEMRDTAVLSNLHALVDVEMPVRDT